MKRSRAQLEQIDAEAPESLRASATRPGVVVPVASASSEVNSDPGDSLPPVIPTSAPRTPATPTRSSTASASSTRQHLSPVKRDPKRRKVSITLDIAPKGSRRTSRGASVTPARRRGIVTTTTSTTSSHTLPATSKVPSAASSPAPHAASSSSSPVAPAVPRVSGVTSRGGIPPISPSAPLTLYVHARSWDLVLNSLTLQRTLRYLKEDLFVFPHHQQQVTSVDAVDTDDDAEEVVIPDDVAAIPHPPPPVPIRLLVGVVKDDDAMRIEDYELRMWSLRTSRYVSAVIEVPKKEVVPSMPPSAALSLAQAEREDEEKEEHNAGGEEDHHSDRDDGGCVSEKTPLGQVLIDPAFIRRWSIDYVIVLFDAISGRKPHQVAIGRSIPTRSNGEVIYVPFQVGPQDDKEKRRSRRVSGLGSVQTGLPIGLDEKLVLSVGDLRRDAGMFSGMSGRVRDLEADVEGLRRERDALQAECERRGIDLRGVAI